MKKTPISLLTIIIISVFYITSLHKFAMWNTGIIGGGDSWGYYLYLPALFIYNDLDNLKLSVEARKQYHKGYYGSPSNPLGVDEVKHIGNGKQVNKYTMGLAILYSPFFLLAHFLAKLLDYPPDGYSFIYIYMMHLSSIVFAITGALFLRKVLLRYFTDMVTAVILATILLATNLYYFTVYNSGMAHAYLFALFCLLIWLTIHWYQTKKWAYAAGIGLTCGFITLIRPTDILCILIPLFWGIGSIKDLKERLLFFRDHYQPILLAIGCFIMAGLPQVLYWKIVSGQLLYYSYGEEGFDFSDPHLKMGLFSFKNGWLAYTPVMYLALTGIFFLYRKRDFLLPVILLLPPFIYITYSWWSWNYINGFGSRPMVDLYGLLAIPLGYTCRFLFNRLIITRILLIGIVTFFSWLNIFNTYQVSLGVLWSEDGNWPYFRSIFGKSELDYNDLVTYDSAEPQPDTTELQKTGYEHILTFEDSLSLQYTSQQVKNGRYAFQVTPEIRYSPPIALSTKEAELQPGNWVKASVWCMRTYEGNDFWRTSWLLVKFSNNEKSIKFRGIRLDNKTGNTIHSFWGGRPNIWEKAHFFIRVPGNFQENDTLIVYVENNSPHSIFLDDMKVEVFEPK